MERPSHGDGKVQGGRSQLQKGHAVTAVPFIGHASHVAKVRTGEIHSAPLVVGTAKSSSQDVVRRKGEELGLTVQSPVRPTFTRQLCNLLLNELLPPNCIHLGLLQNLDHALVTVSF